MSRFFQTIEKMFFPHGGTCRLFMGVRARELMPRGKHAKTNEKMYCNQASPGELENYENTG
jgi:hypothetical protein